MENNQLKIFNSQEFGEVRTVEFNGKPYFIANDVAKCLGYLSPKDAISRHCKGATFYSHPTDGGFQKIKIIPEGDMYRLIIKSKLPQAEKFESWVMDEVLPSLRKTGTYAITTAQPNEMVANLVQSTMAAILPVITQEMAKVTVQNQIQINQMAGILHDQSIIHADELEVIKDLIGFKSANTMRMVTTIKNMLTYKLGTKIMANNPKFLKVKKEVFKEYKVVKWEDVAVEKYNSVFAFVDEYIEEII